MVERLHFNKERLEAIRSIGHEALDDVVKLYGAGYPTWEGTMKYTYHNRHHSYMTGIQAGAIAAEAGQGESVRALTEGIGFSHDRVYTGNRGQDERESAEWLKERLLLRGISRPAAEIASLAIIGTE